MDMFISLLSLKQNGGSHHGTVDYPLVFKKQHGGVTMEILISFGFKSKLEAILMDMLMFLLYLKPNGGRHHENNYFLLL